MNIISLLLFLIWLALSYLVVRFVLRTGGVSKIGHIAHWFGGLFTIIGLAVGMVWIFAQLDGNFGARVKVYLLTHDVRPGKDILLIERHSDDELVTVYRPGSINSTTRLDGGQLNLDEHKTIRTSLWWMLWDTKFSSPKLNQ